MNEFLVKQIEEKNKMKEEIKNLKTEERICIKILENEHKDAIQGKHFDKKMKLTEYKRLLDEQILNKKDSEFMNANEKKMNSYILRLSGEK